MPACTVYTRGRDTLVCVFTLLGSASIEVAKEVPKNVAGMVAGLKSSTENSLNQGCSRLDIELPPSFQLLGL